MTDRLKRIVIDPGHGGWDLGATPVDIGRGGCYEATFNWRLSEALGDYLLATYQVELRYTHEGDHTSLWPTNNLAAELAGRSHVANAWPADLLISIHHDSTGNPAVRGGSLWVWTHKRNPKDPKSLAWLPATGNHVDPKSHPVALRVVDPIREALSSLGVPWRSFGDPLGIATADFGILRNTSGPAILLEAFHGSNEEDCTAARRPEFIHALARAIGDALAVAMNLPRRGHPPNYVEVTLPPAPDDPLQRPRVVAGELRGNSAWVQTDAGDWVPLRAVAWIGGRQVDWTPAASGQPARAVVR